MTAAARNDTKWQRRGIDNACTYRNGLLQNLDFLLRMMGQNVSEGGGSILGAAEDNGRCRSATDDSARRREWRKRAEAFGRHRKMAVRRTTIAFLAGGRRSCVSAEGEREAEAEGEAGGVPLTITPPLDKH